MDLKIISDKDYSLLVTKYRKIEQLTKNVGEIIKLLNKYELDKLKMKNGEHYLIDIKPENLLDIFANINDFDETKESKINNKYYEAIIKIKEILITQSSSNKIIFVENPIQTNCNPLWSENNSLIYKNIFLDSNYIDTWALVKKNIVNAENILVISYAAIINPINKSELIKEYSESLENSEKFSVSFTFNESDLVDIKFFIYS